MKSLMALAGTACALALAAPVHAAPDDVSGSQSAAAQAVTTIYNQVVPGCTMHHNVGNIQSISWDSFNPASGGSGRINDANASLGGPFQVAYWNTKVGPAQDSPPFRASGQWGVNLEFC